MDMIPKPLCLSPYLSESTLSFLFKSMVELIPSTFKAAFEDFFKYF